MSLLFFCLWHFFYTFMHLFVWYVKLVSFSFVFCSREKRSVSYETSTFIRDDLRKWWVCWVKLKLFIRERTVSFDFVLLYGYNLNELFSPTFGLLPMRRSAMITNKQACSFSRNHSVKVLGVWSEKVAGNPQHMGFHSLQTKLCLNHSTEKETIATFPLKS